MSKLGFTAFNDKGRAIVTRIYEPNAIKNFRSLKIRFGLFERDYPWDSYSVGLYRDDNSLIEYIDINDRDFFDFYFNN